MDIVYKPISQLIDCEYTPTYIPDPVFEEFHARGIPDKFIKKHRELIKTHKRETGKSWRDIDLVCLNCATVFNSQKICSSRIPIFCSKDCSALEKSNPKQCLNCGETYVNYQNKYFCSMECAGKYKRGQSFSKEHKDAISEAKKGKPIKHFVENSEEIRKKISDSLKGKPQPWNRGENHPNYVDGGKSAHARQKAMGRVKYKEWRRAVFERDDYTCQKCGERGGNLCADHIKPWATHPMLRYVVSNGRTLCDDCHKKTDTFGGRIERKPQYQLI